MSSHAARRCEGNDCPRVTGGTRATGCMATVMENGRLLSKAKGVPKPRPLLQPSRKGTSEQHRARHSQTGSAGHQVSASDVQEPVGSGSRFWRKQQLDARASFQIVSRMPEGSDGCFRVYLLVRAIKEVRCKRTLRATRISLPPRDDLVYWRFSIMRKSICESVFVASTEFPSTSARRRK